MVALCSGSRHKEMNVFGKPRRVREKGSRGQRLPPGRPGVQRVRCPPGLIPSPCFDWRQGRTDTENSALQWRCLFDSITWSCPLSGCQPQVKLPSAPS